jgi:hypothetical protein
MCIENVLDDRAGRSSAGPVYEHTPALPLGDLLVLRSYIVRIFGFIILVLAFVDSVPFSHLSHRQDLHISYYISFSPLP